MSIFNYKQRNNIILVATIVLGCFLVYALSGLFSAILGAIVIFTIFRPLFINLVEKRHWNKTLVALLIIFSSLIVIVIPFLVLSLMVVAKISSLNIGDLPIQDYIYKVDIWVSHELNQPKLAENTLQKAGSFIAELFPSILGSAVNIIITLLAMYFLLYFMFTQIREFEKGILKYAPFREQHALKFAQALKDSTYSNVLGQGIIAVTQGTLLALGFFAFGIPSPVFWGVIGTFISFLPVVGAPTLTIPA